MINIIDENGEEGGEDVNVIELFNFLINHGQCLAKDEAKMFQKELFQVKKSSSAMFALAMAYAAQNNGNLDIKEFQAKRFTSKKKKANKKKETDADTSGEIKDPTIELQGNKLTVDGIF
jgi:hypothetical protein